MYYPPLNNLDMELIPIKESNENVSLLFKDKYKEIRELFAPHLTDTEFKYFATMSISIGANPFLKEIFAQKNSYTDKNGNKNEQLSIFCGRDFYRRKAQEQPDYHVHIASAVYENDVFEKNGATVIHKSTLKNRGKLVGAYASLWKKNSNIPFTVYVEFEEYAKYKTDYKTGAKELMSTWKSMPTTMICKVAESQVLRMAYQGIFGGTYDESEQWNVELPNEPAKIQMTDEVLANIVENIAKNGHKFWKENKQNYSFTPEQEAIINTTKVVMTEEKLAQILAKIEKDKNAAIWDKNKDTLSFTPEQEGKILELINSLS